MIAMYFVLSLVLVSAVLAVTSKNIIYAVVALLSTNVTLGMAYYMMGAPMVSLFQLAIFAGAVVVFFVITVMLTSGGDMEYDVDPSPLMNKKTQLALAVIAIEIMVTSSLGFRLDFPYMEYASSAFESFSISAGSYDDITAAVSQFLWQVRGMDLIIQSFVILTAVICTIAMLKMRREAK
jgi:NADH:ubiquinone oxidoreductase subunit 6 (subunit J)